MRAGQRDDGGNPQAAFEQLGLPAGERPGVGEALAAVVAGEDDDGVVGEAVRSSASSTRPTCRSIASIMRCVGLLRAAVEVARAAPGEPLRFGFVARRLPRPVRRVEVQAEQKGLLDLRIAVDDLHGAVCRAGRSGSRSGGSCTSSSQRSSVSTCLVRVVVDRAAAEARRNGRSRSAAGRTSAAGPGATCRRASCRSRPSCSSDGSVGCSGGRPTSRPPPAALPGRPAAGTGSGPVISAVRVAEQTAELA